MTDTNGTRVEEFEYSEPPSPEPGVYPGRLVFVEAVEHEKYGLRWRWHFVADGMALERGDKLGTELYGKPCQLVVSRDDVEGWNRVDSVLPATGPKPKATLADTAAAKAAAIDPLASLPPALRDAVAAALAAQAAEPPIPTDPKGDDTVVMDA
jgi:hypothetical protein